jgi:ORF6N domain
MKLEGDKAQSIESRILVIRGQRVMLDADLAKLYEVEVKAFNQAVKRNIDASPPISCSGSTGKRSAL